MSLDKALAMLSSNPYFGRRVGKWHFAPLSGKGNFKWITPESLEMCSLQLKDPENCTWLRPEKARRLSWRLVSDSCFGNLKGKRKAKLTTSVTVLMSRNAWIFSWTMLWSCIWHCLTDHQQSQGDLSRKNLNCLVPKDWREDSKWADRVGIHLPGSRGAAGTSG